MALLHTTLLRTPTVALMRGAPVNRCGVHAAMNTSIRHDPQLVAASLTITMLKRIRTGNTEANTPRHSVSSRMPECRGLLTLQGCPTAIPADALHDPDLPARILPRCAV